MGQRLTVDILEDGERIGLIYYHWSAYFDSTIWELKRLKDYIVKAKKEEKDILLSIIDGIESSGGGVGVTPENREAAKKMYPDREFKEDINRNYGLIYLDEKEIDRVYEMTEGIASIDIDAEEVINEVNLEFDTYFDFNSFPIDPFDVMTFDQLEEVFNYIMETERKKE